MIRIHAASCTLHLWGWFHTGIVYVGQHVLWAGVNTAIAPCCEPKWPHQDLPEEVVSVPANSDAPNPNPNSTSRVYIISYYSYAFSLDRGHSSTAYVVRNHHDVRIWHLKTIFIYRLYGLLRVMSIDAEYFFPLAVLVGTQEPWKHDALCFHFQWESWKHDGLPVVRHMDNV